MNRDSGKNRDSRPLHLPIIHNNGTSRRMILDQLENVMTALTDASNAMMKAAPNRRDYYVGPPEAWQTALNTHARRCKAIADVYNEIMHDAIMLVDEE